MEKFIVAVLFGLVLFSPKEAMAWGKSGHVTICEIAYRNFTPTTRFQVNTLLHADGEYVSYNYSCLEEDEFPRRNQSDHFANYPRTLRAVTGPDCPTANSCILAGINRDLETLADIGLPNKRRAAALFGLGHWLGDIHQPLHISFADDRGGNKIKKRGICSSDNLHAVWDNCIVERQIFKTHIPLPNEGWARFTKAYRAADRLIEKTTAAERAAWTNTKPWQWAAESYEIAIMPDVQYCVMVNNQCQYSEAQPRYRSGQPERVVQMTPEYLAKFEPIADMRIRQAGFRLAHKINQILDPNYN